jgi:hypothetical protein
MTDHKRPFLVAYDRGKIGALWGVINARSASEISRAYPELVVVPQRPEWMSEIDLQKKIQQSYDIDEAPRGLLGVILNDRAEA